MPWKICRWRSLSTCLAAAIARPTACWIRLGPFLGNFRRGGRSCKRSLTTYPTTPRSVTSTPAQPKQRGMPVPSSAAWRAARTMQLYRAVIFRAVERDQHVIAQPTEEGEPAASLQHFERVGKQRMEALRLRGPTYPEHGCRSESAPSKQRLAVRATMPVPVRQRPLMGQERRALHGEHRKRRHAGIGHEVLDVFPAPLVRQTRTGRPQRRYKVLDRPGWPAMPSSRTCRSQMHMSTRR
jgi:hypothetical protein